MGRAKISPQGWEEIIKRRLAGERATHLAIEFKVTEGAIRKKVSTELKSIKETAKQILEAEEKFNSFEIGTKIKITDYVNSLRRMSDNMLSAAVDSSATSKKLSSIAKKCADNIPDDPKPEDLEETLLNLKVVDFCQGVANKANIIPMSLLTASKDNASKLLDLPASEEEKDSIPNGLGFLYGE